MKKILIPCSFVIMYMAMLVFMFLASFGSGGAGSIASPLVAFATEEEAYAYQYIGAELGVPWDIVLLADGMKAYEAGEKNLQEYNPMLTSLQFCILLEEEIVPVLKKNENASEEKLETDESSDSGKESETGKSLGSEEKPEASESSDDENSESEQDSEEEKELEKEEIVWETQALNYYTGLKEILEYIGAKEEDLSYSNVTSIIADINEAAEEKSTGEVKYIATLMVNPDYEDVLRELIGLSDSNIEYALEVYDTHYLVYLYGYSVDYSNVVLPEIIQGEISRQQLAEVAISLLGHPYMMGGKSNQAGPPVGPLDCSGYVDWVYTQCFGKVVSSGQIPEGVAVSGTAQQWYASEEISESELRVGDLGFLYDPASMRSGQVNHVGIYIGTYEGRTYWIHCAGRAYGTKDSPTGRVGISCISSSNSYNPVTGGTFEPAMSRCRFRYFRRPRFSFTEE